MKNWCASYLGLQPDVFPWLTSERIALVRYWFFGGREFLKLPLESFEWHHYLDGMDIPFTDLGATIERWESGKTLATIVRAATSELRAENKAIREQDWARALGASACRIRLIELLDEVSS